MTDGKGFQRSDDLRAEIGISPPFSFPLVCFVFYFVPFFPRNEGKRRNSQSIN